MATETTWKFDSREFAVTSRVQQEWNWLIAVALFFAGVGSGTFVMAELVMGYPTGALVGIGVAGVGSSLAFFLDLGRKSQFWRVMLRPKTSWISRGIILLILFTLSGLLYLLTPTSVFLWIAVASALGVMMYSGFVLSYSPAIPFWNTPLLPILSILYALMGGIGLLFAMNSGSGSVASLETMQLGLAIIAAILIFAYLIGMSSSTLAARHATRTLVAGNLALAFWALVIIGGLVIPVSLTLLVRAAGLNPGVLALAGLLELVGGFSFRYLLLKSGVVSALA